MVASDENEIAAIISNLRNSSVGLDHVLPSVIKSVCSAIIKPLLYNVSVSGSRYIPIRIKIRTYSTPLQRWRWMFCNYQLESIAQVSHTHFMPQFAIGNCIILPLKTLEISSAKREVGQLPVCFNGKICRKKGFPTTELCKTRTKISNGWTLHISKNGIWGWNMFILIQTSQHT